MPIPLNAKRARNPPTNSGSEPTSDARSTTAAAAAIAAKFAKVTRAPPRRSASRPPRGRTSEPISGPRNVRYAAFTGVENVSANCTSSTWPNAKLKPMNEPNVPM